MRSRLLIVLAALCFSTTGTMQRLGPDEASSLSIAAVRTVIGTIVLVLIARFTVNGTPSGHLPKRELILAGLGMALFAGAFFSGVRMTGIAVGTVIALGSAPLFAGVGSFVVWREVPSKRWIVTTMFAVAGMSLIILTGDDAQVDMGGVVAATLAGAGYAMFALSSKTIMRRATNAAGAMASVFAIATLVLAPNLFIDDVSWIVSWGGAGMAMWLGIVTVALAYWAYSTGLKHLSPADATALTIVEPVAATMLAVVVFREQPGLLAWCGIVIVIASLSLGSREGGSSVHVTDR